MPDDLWRLGILAFGFYWITRTVDPQLRRRRLLLWGPLPIAFVIMWVVIDSNPSFWESDRAAFPAIAFLLAYTAYAIMAVRAERKLR